ncbi:MAG TPA: glycosyltransferase family 4 protein [Ruminiclostridium sp.]|nr:glycosyltransferase family 4 protein [Ruminiclostridium sp.]
MPRLLLISFIDFGEMKSGSSVRPQRMYDAFKKLGYDVNLLSGLQNRKRERWKRVFQKFLEIRHSLPDLCYVEPPSGPFFNLCDHLLLIYLKLKKVPIGLFYRDAYWLFADWWPVKGAKKFFLTLMHKFDIFIIKRTCKVVFFPTKSMADLFKLKHKSVLPPAGIDFVTPEHETKRHALYIGGVSKFYGTDIMLEAFRILNEQKNENVRLTVCCRETEMKDFFQKYSGAPWLEVVHLSGDKQLKPLYENCDIALYPSRRDFYMDFCMPVKLFEYLSRAIPVVTTNCRETAGFVLKNGFGVVSQDNPEAFASAVKSVIDDKKQLRQCRANAINSLRHRNLWIHRARQAANEILK